MSTIINYSDSNTIINGTGSADSIWTFSDNTNVTIAAGAGEDTIHVGSSYVSVNAGDGNDSIGVNSLSDHVTVNPGAGDDKISLYSSSAKNNYNVVQYASGDGNDIITGFGSDDTLQITSGTYTTTKSGNDVILNVGSGSITVKSAPVNLKVSGTYGSSSTPSTPTTPSTPSTPSQSSSAVRITNKNDNTVVSGSSSNDTIYNYGSRVGINAYAGNDYLVSFSTLISDSYYGYVTIDGGAGDDTVEGFGHLTYINGGSGNDSLYSSGKNNTVIAGTGNDYVVNYGSYNIINAGTGNDTIENKSIGDHSTITGGAGNDLISLSSASDANVIVYSAGDGDDTILGFNTDDTLYITNGTYTKADSGSDLILTIGSGTVRFAGMAGKDLSVIGTESNGELVVDTVPSSEVISQTEKQGDATTINYYTTVIGGDYVVNNITNNITNTTNITNNVVVGITVNQDNSVHINNSYTEQNFSLSNYTQYNNVINIDGSGVSGAKYLTGNSNSNSIKAGSGGSTLYGGGQGNNTLVGGSGRDFFQYSGGGYDTAKNFTTGRNANSDVLYFSSSVTSLSRESSSMYFNSADGTRMQVNNSSSVNEAIQYTTDGTNISYAKVGYAEKNNSFTYEDGVNFYSGGNHTDVLNVTNYQGKNVWLDGSAGVAYSGINNIDASSSSGNNTLAGDGGNNQITAGSGNDSLWGGSGGSADVLVGGSGSNMFWYGKGDGNDTIQNSKTQDVVNLYDVTLADITTAGFNGSAISVGFNTGFSLNVNVSSNLSSTFRLADGSNWQYNKSAGNWQNA